MSGTQSFDQGNNQINDPCYGTYFLLNKENLFLLSAKDTPFTAPGSILRDTLSSIIDRKKLEDLPIHPDFKDLLSLQEGNSLLHAVGTWYIAEQCLEFGRIKFSESHENISGAETTLAKYLKYGRNEVDTLFEVCLAVFFQAYLERDPQVRNDQIDSNNVPTSTIRFIENQLKYNNTYLKYIKDNPDAILIDIIAYWVSGGKSPGLDIWEKVKEVKEGFKNSQSWEKRLVKVRRLFFSPDAPLNLRHLDIISRIYKKDNGKVQFTKILRSFLNRLRFAKRNEETAIHLLPNDSYWSLLTPYYIPHADDISSRTHEKGHEPKKIQVKAFVKETSLH